MPFPASRILHPYTSKFAAQEFFISMSIVRVGATKQYSDNWTNIFGGGKSRLR